MIAQSTLKSCFLAVLIAAAFALSSAALSAQEAQTDSSVETARRDFYLFDWSVPKIVTFDISQDVRVCNDYRRHNISLVVKCDNTLVTVAANQCHSCRATVIELRPDKPLSDDLSLSGTIEHHAVLQANTGEPPQSIDPPEQSMNSDEPAAQVSEAN